MLVLISTFDGLSPELVTTAVARGRFCEQLAPLIGAANEASDLFFAGLFSMADVMMGLPIDEALTSIPLCDGAREAILDPMSRSGRLVAAATAYQQADWARYVELASSIGIDPGEGAGAYLDALSWTDQLLAG
jgi:c-di-GMP-related signal transduction protein